MKVRELKRDMDERFTGVDQRFAELRREMDSRFTAVHARVVEEGQITRRHFDVVAEDLAREIRTLAAALAEGQKSLNENPSEHGTFIAALSDHELRLRVLEDRAKPGPR
jgi:hypothetical protein